MALLSKPTLYLETTVPSYYASRPSTDVVLAAHQRITKEWWDSHIHSYRVFVSAVVYDEIRRGDALAATRRLESISNFEVLGTTREVDALAAVYMKRLSIPDHSSADAMHLAIASVNDISYLVTWNCKHLARASVIRALPSINEALGLGSPTICTPEEMLYDL